MIEQELHIAEKMINDLINFADTPTSDREPVSISELVRRILVHFPMLPSVKINLKLPADLPKVYLNRYQMEQVLGNLVINAGQAMKDDGELVISNQ